MKTLYLECRMGAAGDMLMAALLELCNDRDDFLRRLNGAGIPKVVVTAELSKKCGIVGTRVRVAVDGREEKFETQGGDGGNSRNNGSDNHEHIEHIHDGVPHHHHGGVSHNHGDGTVHRHDEPHHSHNSYHDIERLIDSLNINDTVKKNALEVYKLIADAESRAHGAAVDKIHFHEVGEADAVADIVGVCMLMDELAPELVLSSPVNLGGGYVRCAHGLLPVPAPATADILRNVPVYSDSADGELCTPTGAALLKHFVKDFRGMPLMAVSKTGYGMGAKDFGRANCLRAYIGEISGIGKNNGSNDISNIDNVNITNNNDNTDDINSINEENIAELSCNLDDMTPEAVSFAQQLLLDEGALDVYTLPSGMKKGRAGLIFTCLCRLEERGKFLRLIFKHTTTLGIREYITHRYILNREDNEIHTTIGRVRIKTAHGFGVQKSKPEYEDIAKLAREKGMSIDDVLNLIKTPA